MQKTCSKCKSKLIEVELQRSLITNNDLKSASLIPFACQKCGYTEFYADVSKLNKN